MIRFKKEDGSLFQEPQKYMFNDILTGKITNGLFNDPEKVGKGVKIINVTDLYNEPVIDDSNLGLLDATPQEISKYKVKKYDLFFTRSSVKASGIAHCNIYVGNDDNVVFDGHVMKASVDIKKAIPQYVKSLMETPTVRKEILKRAKTTAFTTIGQEDLGKIHIYIHDLGEQKKIVDFLSDINYMISIQEQQLAILEEQKKGVMQKIFSQEVRFKDNDGNEYPEWEEKSLNDVADIYDGTHQTPQYVESGIKFVSVEDIKNLYKTEKFITKDSYDKDFKDKPAKGDVLMTRIGDIGTPAYVGFDEELAYYVSLALIKCRDICGKYLLYYIQSINFKNELWKRTLHTAYPKKINKGDIGICKVLCPYLKEQEKIINFLSDYDYAIEIKKKKLEAWKTIKKGLIQKMFV